MGIGDWGLGIGDWGLGMGPNPQSPIQNSILSKNLSSLIILYLAKYNLAWMTALFRSGSPFNK